MSQMPLGNGKKTKGQRRENRRVKDKPSRQVTFSKRRAGLWKQASEIAVLCHANIAIVAFSEAGRAFAFGSPSADPVLGYVDGAVPAAAADDPVDWKAEALFRETKEKGEEVKAEAARMRAAGKKVVEVQTQAGKPSWWEADVDALGEAELPVFAKALERFTDIVGRRAVKLASAPPPE